MFRKLLDKKQKKPAGKTVLDPLTGKWRDHSLSPDLSSSQDFLQQLFADCSDMVMREIEMGIEGNPRGLVIYVDGLAATDSLEDGLLKSLMIQIYDPGKELGLPQGTRTAARHYLPLPQVALEANLGKLVDGILDGDTALLLDGSPEAVLISARGWEKRAIDEPDSEAVVRGPREGLVETLRTNTAMIRRRIKSPRLKFVSLEIGRLTRTKVNLVYVQGIAREEVVAEARRRLEQIDIDGVLDSNYLEEFIRDNYYTPFPLLDSTERPDKAAGNLLEGRVVVLADNSPFALILPAAFIDMLQSAEDYYTPYYFATFIRLLRFLALNISLLLPAVYVALITFHQELLPTPLLLSIAASREAVPFPAVVEALAMETTFELLREAGVRLPRPVGQAVSIVGALVIGQAAVQAGIVSSAMVIIVALTAIASFTIPSVSASFPLRLLRFPLIVLAATLGLFGIMAGLMALLFHLVSLRSFGLPYLYPIAPLALRDLKDTILRFPWPSFKRRPHLIAGPNVKRQGE